MKCLCGYEKVDEGQFVGQLEHRIAEEPDFKNGDEDFRCFPSSAKYRYCDVGWSSDGSGGEDIYACPKCGTVKIDL